MPISPNSHPASDNVFLQTYLAIKTKQTKKQTGKERKAAEEG